MYINTATTIVAILLLIVVSAFIAPSFAAALSVAYAIAGIVYLIYWLIVVRHKKKDIPERFAKLTRWTRPYIFRLTYTRTRSRQAVIRRMRQAEKYTELSLSPDGATGYIVYYDGASIGCVHHKWAKFIKKYGGANNFAVFLAGVGMGDGEHYVVDVYLTFDRKKKGR